jgi:hypothetical protein
VKLYPRSYPDILEATKDFAENSKRKSDSKVLRSLHKKVLESQPRAGSDVVWVQMHLTHKESEYFNAITDLIGVKDSKAIESK